MNFYSNNKKLIFFKVKIILKNYFILYFISYKFSTLNFRVVICESSHKNK